MASPQGNGEPAWTASRWLPFLYPEIASSPEAFGVVILGDKDRDPLLVAHGVIRDELWSFYHSPRSAASGAVFFRYVETTIREEAERLARIVQDELTKTTGHPIIWEDFPSPPWLDAAHDGFAVGVRIR